jgi:hypothetical protein
MDSRRYRMIGGHDPWHMPRSYLLHCHNLIKYMQTITDVVSQLVSSTVL